MTFQTVAAHDGVTCSAVRLRGTVLFFVCLAVAVAELGCGGSSSSTPTTPVSNPPSVSFSMAPPPTMFSGTPVDLMAAISGDSTNSGVTWSCTPAATCGTNPFSSPTALPTAFNAPSLTTPASVTITVTSNADSSVSASAVVAILANSNYVYSVSGSNINVNGSPSLYNLSGVLSINNGNITGGEQDFTGVGNDEFDQIGAFSSAIIIDPNGNLKITLALCTNASGPCSQNPDPSVGVAGVETFEATVLPQNPKKAFITEFDASATSSGTLQWQDPAAAAALPSGGYVFGLNGLNGSQEPLSMAGVINFDGAGGSISGAGSIFDAGQWNGRNGSGTNFQAQSVLPSGILPAGIDFRGRFLLTLNPGTGSNNATGLNQFTLAGYIVDANHIQLAEIGGDALQGTLGGTALSQGANTGKFNSTSVAGNSYVFGLGGIDVFRSAQLAGLFTANSDGTVSGFANFNDLSLPGSPSAIAGTYAADPGTGRVTMSNVKLGPNGIANLEFYLDGNGHALASTLDGEDVLGGVGFQQTGGGSFGAASLKGAYPMNATGWHQNSSDVVYELDAVGLVTASGSGGTFSGAADLNWLSNTGPVFVPAVSATFTPAANGVFTGTITGLDSGSATNADSFVLYLIDPAGDGIAIENDTHQITLLNLFQQ